MKSTILAVDDLEVGHLITVHSGATCEAGCCEEYRAFKGVPMLVLAINLPYVVCSLPGNVNAHFDTRECDLMRVTDAYAAPFGFVLKKG